MAGAGEGWGRTTYGSIPRPAAAGPSPGNSMRRMRIGLLATSIMAVGVCLGVIAMVHHQMQARSALLSPVQMSNAPLQGSSMLSFYRP